MAIGLHRDGRWDGAEKLYRRLLELQPDDGNALHFLGMLLHQRGRRDEALPLLERSVAIDPNVAAWHNNLGNALLEAGRGQEAADAYVRCSDLDPGNLEVLNNLGCMLMRIGRHGEADAAFERLLALKPDFADAHSNYATLLCRTQRLPEAFKHYARALELQPGDLRTRRLLGVVYAQSGRLEEAAAVFREWMAQDPDDPQARHHLAAVTGVGVPERAPDDYVVDVFDRFARSFDERLAALDYQAPRLVGELIAAQLPPPRRDLDVLDAGCGTGLCAPWLQPHARRLTGVDLSPGMLERAAQRGGYDALVAAELVAYLRGAAGAFDLIVSADTLCYFGALHDVLGAGAQALRRGGRIVFTLEAHELPDDYKLQPHGRYSHRRDYVLRLLEAAGLSPASTDAVVLRKEAGHAVNGWLVSAVRAHF